MEITPKWDLCEGSFDTKDVKMTCVGSDRQGSIVLGVSEPHCSTIYPVAKIKLFSRDLYVDFKETCDDAKKLGDEIARRWNEAEEKL
ncbi:MAG: hypothetical protein LBK58_08705 [Prevotellaceae bacterium]|nr:hypothetical protein [Prevotellaceae bacterium]